MLSVGGLRDGFIGPLGRFDFAFSILQLWRQTGHNLLAASMSADLQNKHKVPGVIEFL